ncbi:Transcriptional regulator, HxlR family protein [Hyalangium minutum]|uniref:Transcriptional regulator, HxlR family protein n=2 Tax=Hyalangium minutum TaxID=394096 RepID=A0A085WU98_9BACT|nr:Transcriptional regulator, HxlR family protein [Hyalangium minutum]
MLVRALANAGGEVRFAELQRRAPGISRKMLAQTLRELEYDGLVARRVEPTIPPAVHYSLTELGRTLIAPLDALREWAETHMVTVDEHRKRISAPLV